MSQRFYEATGACLISSLWKEGTDEPVPQWLDDKFWNPLEIFPAEGPILTFVQAGELAVEVDDLIVGEAGLHLDPPHALPSIVTWKPKTPFAHESSSGSPHTLKKQCRLKAKGIVHKYCTVVGKFFLYKRMN